jgi:hypothetical protein
MAFAGRSGLLVGSVACLFAAMFCWLVSMFAALVATFSLVGVIHFRGLQIVLIGVDRFHHTSCDNWREYDTKPYFPPY